MSGTRLRLVAHAPTPGLRRAFFGGDEGLDEGGLRAALALAERGRLGRPDRCLSSPAPAAMQTARALGYTPSPESALADCGYGDWTARPLDDIAAAEPDAVRQWLSDPDAAPHRGEAITALIARIGRWLDQQAATGQRLVAVTHAAVIRAAIVHALHAPPAAFWQIDVAPLSVTRLRWRPPRWALHLTGPYDNASTGAAG